MVLSVWGLLRAFTRTTPKTRFKFYVRCFRHCGIVVRHLFWGARAAQRARLAAAYASLSNGGFGLEDAAALAALSALASRAGGTHHWPEAARDYFEESRACRQAGLLKQPQGA